MTFQRGELFARDFKIIRPLGGGAMGTLYVAEQVSTGAQRALKLINNELLTDERVRTRFAQEARIGGLIESDHVVQVIAAGVDEASGLPFMAMELLKGEDLARRLSEQGAMAIDEVALISEQLCHALAAAHSVGVVHRDLKPENIFLATSRRAGVPFMVKVLDYGVAKIVAEARASTTAAIGTPLFMAPEQATSSDDIGPHTDVWALGLLLFRMLTGLYYWRTATTGRSLLDLMREVTLSPLMKATERAKLDGREDLLPEGFDEWFALCVHRNPSHRFATGGAAWAALETVLRPRAVDSATPWQSASYPRLNAQTTGTSMVASLQTSREIGRIEIDEPARLGGTGGSGEWARISRPPWASSTASQQQVRAAESLSLEPDRLSARYDEYVAEGRHARAACIAGVLEFAGRADARQRAHYTNHVRTTPRFRAPLGERQRQKLLGHPHQDHGVEAVVASIVGAVRRWRADAEREPGSIDPLDGAIHEDASTTVTTLGKTFFGVTRVLSLAAPQLYVAAERPGRFEAVPTDAPTTLACAGVMTGLSRRELAFYVAEHVVAYRVGDDLRTLLAGVEEVEAMVHAALSIASGEHAVPAHVLGQLEPMRAALDAHLFPAERAALSATGRRWVAQGIDLDVARYLQACELVAARAGLLASDDVATAARLAKVSGHSDGGLTPSERVDDLLVFAVSEPYFQARELVGLDA